MKIVRENLIKNIFGYLERLSSVVVMHNKNGYMDINKSSETLFIGVLNRIYGLNLEDLNRIQNNYPAIDLGDYQSRVCFQITAESTSSKFRKTVKTFKENNLSKDFDKLFFLIISNKPKCTLTDDEIDTEIINIYDLSRHLSSLNTDILKSLENYLNAELILTEEVNRSILPPRITPSCIYREPFTFIKYLGLDQDNLAINNLKSDLNDFIQMLLELNQNQKEFLYYIVSKGRYDSRSRYRDDFSDGICIPTSQISQAFGDYNGKQLFDSLKYLKFIFINDEYDPCGDDRFITAMEIYFSKKLDSMNLFSCIKSFCEGNDTNLRKIMIDCDFSCLG